jgi:hypothetical protein
MNTDQLITQLSTQPRRSARAHYWQQALLIVLAVAVTGALSLLLLGVRPDIVVQLTLKPFLIKLAGLLGFVLLALLVLRKVTLPDVALSAFRVRVSLLAGALLLTTGALTAGIDFASLRAETFHCIIWITSLGLVPLAFFVVVLRRGAVANPRPALYALALASWAVSSLAYTLHCTADLALDPASGNLTMLFLYALALPVFFILARMVQPLFARW